MIRARLPASECVGREETGAVPGAGDGRGMAWTLKTLGVAAFDRAVAVTRTPVPFGDKLKACVRPYLASSFAARPEQAFHLPCQDYLGLLRKLGRVTVHSWQTGRDDQIRHGVGHHHPIAIV